MNLCDQAVEPLSAERQAVFSRRRMSSSPPPSQAAPGASKGRTLLILSLYQMLSNNRSSLFTVFFVLYVVQKDGVSVTAALAAFSAAYVAASLTGPFAGRLSDRMGRRRLLLIVSEAASLPFFVLIPRAPTWLRKPYPRPRSLEEVTSAT